MNIALDDGVGILSALAVALALSCAIGTHWSLYRDAIKGRREVARFKMFAARDALVSLVVECKVDENHKAWRAAYESVNGILGLYEDLHIGRVIKAFVNHALSLERDPNARIEDKKMRRHISALGKAVPEFREALRLIDEGLASIVKARTTVWDVAKVHALVLFWSLVVNAFGVMKTYRSTRDRLKTNKFMGISTFETC